MNKHSYLVHYYWGQDTARRGGVARIIVNDFDEFLRAWKRFREIEGKTIHEHYNPQITQIQREDILSFSL